MSIVFTKQLSTENFLNAYNNSVVEFSSDSGVEAEKATISIGTLEFEILPINEVFRFNLKEVITVLINSNNFQDDTLPELEAGDTSSFVYDNSDNTYLEQLVGYQITFIDGDTESICKTYKFLKSVEQLEQNKVGLSISSNDMYMLSTFKEATNNSYNVTYFEGYPFDISILLANPGTTTILNKTNALSYSFEMNNTVNRLFFSDGRITISIADYLPLIDGLNELQITRGSNSIFVNVYKVAAKAGQYVKWQNQYGGWSYWLFNCIHNRERKVSDSGEVNNDFDNIENTTSPLFDIGKTSQDTLTLISKCVEQEDQEVLDGILDSPKVYYFTGTRLSQVNDVSWLAVKVKTSSIEITDYKKKAKELQDKKLKFLIDIQ